ncbi:MAG: TolC family protein [Deltaproteobacteria bacterium]|nr:TolC family protein [Deltaproteobacteria bacterium]
MIAVLLLLAQPARPLSLAEATEIAVAADPDVSQRSIDEERARLQLLRANLARIRASVDVTVQGLYSKSNIFGPLPAGCDKADAAGCDPSPNVVLGLGNIEARVDAPLFSGWRVEAEITRAEHLRAAAWLDIEAERSAVAVAVARAYWGERRLALLEERQAASEERLAESERIVLARVKAGIAAGIDVNRAAARRVQLDVDRLNLRSQRHEAHVRLVSLLQIDEPVELSDVPPDATAAVDDDAVLVQRALDARPELRAANARILALDEEKRSAESAYWPQLGAGVLVQLGNNPSVAGAGNRAVGGGFLPVGDVQAGVSLTMNLFDTWATTHSVDDVGHRQRRAAADVRALVREVETNVRLARANVVSLQEQRAGLVRARAIVDDNAVILQKAYERGEVLLTEVLDAQLDLFDAERQIVDVDARLALAVIELDRSVGDAP